MPIVTMTGEMTREATSGNERKAFAVLAEHLRREFRRFDLSERQMIVALTLVDLTLAWGKTSIRVPRLDVFTELTGISKGNIHSALKQLHERRIVKVTEVGGSVQYALNPDSDNWQVAPRQSRTSIEGALNFLRAFNGLEGKSKELEEAIANVTSTEQGKGASSNFNFCPCAYIAVCSNFLGTVPKLIPPHPELPFPPNLR